MGTFGHGGDSWDYDVSLLDFSANLNPLGMPPEVAAAAMEAVADSAVYPDPRCRALTAAIAAHDGVEPPQVLCGAGCADLIFRLTWALRPRRGLVTAPAFGEYEQALAGAGAAVSYHLLNEEDDFDLTESILEALTEEVDLLFLCSPNNPTGRSVRPALLGRILTRCRERGIVLALDECFLPLAGGGMGLAPVLGEYPNLLLLRAFTKSYAIPGLRLGYCLSADRDLLASMVASGPPWGVSAPAQAAGLAALTRPDWPELARRLLDEARPALAAGLTGLGLKVVPGSANYLLFRCPGVPDLKERLIPRGVLIRSCANFRGLGPDWYRAAVGTREKNELLLRALKEAL